MKLLALLPALLTVCAWAQDPPQQQPADPNLKEYSNLFLGMKFNYPKTWELTQNKKNGDSRLLIPIEGTAARGVVEVATVNFRSEKDQWQIAELAMNKSLNRTVDKQWEEEILGVPLLLTKVHYTDKGIDKVSETGLIYALGFHKLMFHVTASPAEFDDIEHSWRSVLETLRTWDGELPQAEDPSVKIARNDPKANPPGSDGKKPVVDDVPHPQVPHVISGPKAAKIVKEPVATVVQLGDKKAEIRLPSDWKIAPGKDGAYLLTNPAVSPGITVAVASSDGGDPADIALLKTSGQNLNDFTAVARRDESLPTPNRGGASIAQIWRKGTTGTGELYTAEASVEGGPLYLILTYRSTSGAKWPAERRAIEFLLERISIEPAP